MSVVVQTANNIGIEPDVLRAFREVESGGAPSAVRFEPHLFFRYRPDTKSQIPFTPTAGGYSLTASETNKAAFERAYKIDPAAAIKSTSWGLFQVLGGTILPAYGNSPSKFLRAFNRDPEGVSFKSVEMWFAASPAAVKAAQAKDWTNLARLYNGPNYAVGQYHTKLRDAYNRISQTPGLVRQATGVAKKVPTWVYVAAPLSLITLALIIRAARK